VTPNENAARWGQPGDGEEHETVSTAKSYHEFLRSATAQSDAPASNRQHSSQSSECAEATSPTEVRIRELVRDIIHDGIRSGRIPEALHRCRLLAQEVERTSIALTLLASTMEAELL